MIHPKTLLISCHFYSLESYIWKSIYNLKIDTLSMYDIPLDRSFLKLWNGIRHVMPSTDRRLELKEKTSMAQNAGQASVYANGLTLALDGAGLSASFPGCWISSRLGGPNRERTCRMKSNEMAIFQEQFYSSFVPRGVKLICCMLSSG